MGEEATRTVVVTHHSEKELDVDDLDAWLDENYPDGRVQVLDAETGEWLRDEF